MISTDLENVGDDQQQIINQCSQNIRTTELDENIQKNVMIQTDILGILFYFF
jgi:hypothetical protein